MSPLFRAIHGQFCSFTDLFTISHIRAKFGHDRLTKQGGESSDRQRNAATLYSRCKQATTKSVILFSCHCLECHKNYSFIVIVSDPKMDTDDEMSCHRNNIGGHKTIGTALRRHSVAPSATTL